MLFCGHPPTLTFLSTASEAVRPAPCLITLPQDCVNALLAALLKFSPTLVGIWLRSLQATCTALRDAVEAASAAWDHAAEMRFGFLPQPNPVGLAGNPHAGNNLEFQDLTIPTCMD